MKIWMDGCSYCVFLLCCCFAVVCSKSWPHWLATKWQVVGVLETKWLRDKMMMMTVIAMRRIDVVATGGGVSTMTTIHDDDDNEYDELLSILQATKCQSAERFNAGLLCNPGRMGSIFDGH